MTSDQSLKPEKRKEQKSSVFSAAGGDIEIFSDIPFPHLDKGTVKAFQATGKNRISENLICYVCDKNLTPRHLAESKFNKVTNLNLVKLIASDVVEWGAEGQKFCLFYEALIGRPLIHKSDKYPALGLKPEEVMAQIVNPILSILSDMRNKDLVHGEIWPGNIYSEEEKSGKHILLGDCLSLPASYNLPYLYEPVERALADPIGKGQGSIEDDLYAFGVSLAVIMRTHDPMEGATPEEIISHKVEKGTYATLISKDRFNGAILELLRGLLYDDAAQRWTLDDIMEWRDGRRLSPKQSTKRIKASRPIEFNHKKYIRPELLAKDLIKKPEEAKRIIEDGTLEQWIERAVEDKTIKMRIEQMIKYLASADRGNLYNDQVSALLATNLYPDCPVRYKNINFHMGGFGKYFSHHYVIKEDIQIFTGVLKAGLLLQIIQVLKANPILSTLRSRFDACRSYLSQTLIGNGIERCLYILNPESPCLSPILEKYYVRTPEEIMRAFEKICGGNSGAILFDRHIVAFLSLKDKKNIDPYFRDLRSSSRHTRILGQLRVLATIQRRSNLEDFPHIANWVSSNLEAVYSQFHDSKKRIDLKKRVKKMSKNGNLSQIAILFDDPKLYQSDVGSFYKAMEYYRSLNKEKKNLEERLEKKTIGYETGNQISAVISIFISLAILIMVLYFKLIVN